MGLTQSLRSGMGVEEPSLLYGVWPGAAPSHGEGGRHLLPFPLSLERTKAEMELSMTSARGDPVSSELIHAAASDVWMFLL